MFVPILVTFLRTPNLFGVVAPWDSMHSPSIPVLRLLAAYAAGAALNDKLSGLIHIPLVLERHPGGLRSLGLRWIPLG